MIDARRLRRFRKSRGAAIGAALVASLVLFALLGPLLASAPPDQSDFAGGRAPDGEPRGPCAAHWLGTDTLFRDELARLAHGARLSLAIGVGASALAIAVGAAVGLVAGFWAGRGVGRGAFRVGPDELLMRLVDVGLGFPFLLLVMAIGASLERTTSFTIFLVLGLTGWLGTARIVRAKVLQIRELDFVLAARALGAGAPRILVVHVLPNLSGVLAVLGTLAVAQMILAESVLGYLGVGLPPPTATWGRMLHEGQDHYQSAPWIAAAPALAILLAVLGFNLLGEGLRDALDARDA